MSEAINYVPGEWYEAKTREELEAFFASRIPAIREAAREQGYAIGLHGSMRRDLDLIAVPWREGASDKDVLAHAIAVAACGITRDGDHQWEVKPLGRLATSLPCCWPSWCGEAGAGHIDLSVMAPQPAPAPHPATPVVSDGQIDAATRHIYHNGRPTTKEYRVGIVRAILALRPAVEPMTPEQMRKAAMDEMSKIPALANHHSWKGWPGTWALATAAVNGITAKAEEDTMSQSQVPPQDTSDLTFTATQFERCVLIQALNCYLEDWANKQRGTERHTPYTPHTPAAIDSARSLLVRLRSELHR